MWVYLNDSFLSIVENEGDPDTLLVRSRSAGDIEAVFPEASVEHTPISDYAFRAAISREEVAVGIAKRVFSIDYPNFKNSVKNMDRKITYTSVWGKTVDGFRTGIFSEGFFNSKYYFEEDDYVEEQGIFSSEIHSSAGRRERNRFDRRGPFEVGFGRGR